MMKFIIVSKHADGGSYERMLYEWSVIHVALMLTTPTVTRVFKRYVQHYGLWDIPDGDLVYPRSPAGWETMAEHWIETFDDLVQSVTAPDYVARMHGHRFSSNEFIIMVGASTTIFDRDDFRSGGIKLLQWHKRREGLSREDFNRRLAAERGPALAAALKPHGLRRYVQTVPVDLDPTTFKGTFFDRAAVGTYAALEEIWLEDAKNLAAIRKDAAAVKAIQDSGADLFQPGESFSIVVLERVAFDFVTKERHRMAAVQDPGSLEASLYGSEAIYREALKHQR
jgi:hypothetical protein